MVVQRCASGVAGSAVRRFPCDQALGNPAQPLEALGRQHGVVNAHDLRLCELGDPEVDESPDIQASPHFRAVEETPRVIYELRDDFWGANIPSNIGRNNFEKIRIEYFADSAAAFEGFKAGVYTFRSENSSKQWATSYNFSAIEAGHVVKTELPDGSLGQAQGYVFNLRREKFQDP